MSVSWVAVERLAAEYPDLLIADEEQMQELLDAAQDVLETYAPALPEGYTLAAVPARYKQALIMHVREVLRTADREDGDVLGVGDYVVRVREMSAHVRSLLRPKAGKPRLR